MKKAELAALERRADQGDVDALFTLGSQYADTDARAAVRYFRRGVALGNTARMSCLADHLERGRGVRRDLAAAVRLWQRMARRGVAIGAFNMAVHHKHRGSYRTAHQWFRKAEQMGDASATLKLAKLRLLGVGVRRDVASAVRDLERVADDPAVTEWQRESSRLVLASLYLDGTLVRRSYATGLAWIDRAITHGSDLAREYRRNVT